MYIFVNITTLSTYNIPHENIIYLPKILSLKKNGDLANAVLAYLNCLSKYHSSRELTLANLYALENDFNEDFAHPEDIWQQNRTVDLSGPFGTIQFSRNMCAFIFENIPWTSEIANVICRVSHEISKILRCADIIFMPDDVMDAYIEAGIVLKDWSIDNVMAYLSEKYGSPMMTLYDVIQPIETRKKKKWAGVGYYIDN